MIVLTPSTSEQSFNILPRSSSDLNSLTLTITDESNKQSETFEDVSAVVSGNYVVVTQAFSFLKENRMYKLTITKDNNNWWRGKAICTSQTDYQLRHSLNTIASTQYLVLEDDETFTILP
jgi:hypothetical protein